MTLPRPPASALIVTVCTWELTIPASRSLKEKRAVLRSLKDRLAKMNVSVAESALQNVRDRAQLSVAFLAAHAAQADSVLSAVDRLVEGVRGVRVVAQSTERY